MGTKLANLFMGALEKKLFKEAPFQPLVYYIDDIFIVFNKPQEDAENRLQYCSSSLDTIKFMMKISDTEVSFLNLQIHTITFWQHPHIPRIWRTTPFIVNSSDCKKYYEFQTGSQAMITDYIKRGMMQTKSR